jgi:molybdopterin converting factor small subunit
MCQGAGGSTGVLVSVRAQGQLKQYRPDRQERFIVEVPEGATVKGLIEASGIPWDEVGLAAIGGRQVGDDRPLQDGEEVLLLAPMEGG